VGGAGALNVIDAGAFSVAKNLPFENKDAYFTSPPLYYGVFDGVSACPESRIYAQTLAKTSCEQLTKNAQAKWPEQSFKALTKAKEAAKKYKGSSTAMLMKVELEGMFPQACIYSLGDCRTLLLRQNRWKGGRYAVAETTIDKIHPENGAPYQFGGAKFDTDEVTDGEDFTFKLAAGDILLSFTDGVADNMQPAEIEELVCRNYMESAEELAKTLVEAARERRAVDDDCTVVAVKLGDGAWQGGEAATQTTPTDVEALQQAAQGFFKGFGK